MAGLSQQEMKVCRAAAWHVHQPDLKGPVKAALKLRAAQEVLERLDSDEYKLCFIKPLALRSSCAETWVLWLLALLRAVPKRLHSQPGFLNPILDMVRHPSVHHRHLPGSPIIWLRPCSQHQLVDSGIPQHALPDPGMTAARCAGGMCTC